MADFNTEPVSLDDEVGRIIQDEILYEFCKNFVLVGEERTCLAEIYLKHADAIKNFEVRKSDIWVASYPKAGTTWTQEMVWMIANNLDFEGAKTNLHFRFPFFESCTISDTERFRKLELFKGLSDYCSSLELCVKQESPRYIKTHLPVPLLPANMFHPEIKPKIIYVWRNPKDVCVSYCHHGNLVQGWRTKLEHFSKVFLADKAQYGSFWKHVLGYWNIRDRENILFIKYEDMKKDLAAVIRRVAHFLEKPIAEEQIQPLCKHLSFESMKKNTTLNGEEFVENLKKHNMVYEDGSFIRSGIVGKYKEELSPETIKKFDDWIKENIAGTSFEAEYDYCV